MKKLMIVIGLMPVVICLLVSISCAPPAPASAPAPAPALSEERASFFVLVTSSNNPLPGYDNHQWRSCRMDARYVIDSVVKNARAGNTRFTNDGIEIRCGYFGSYLDPVPSDAKNLTFIITKLGDWEGPWEFKVPLE